MALPLKGLFLFEIGGLSLLFPEASGQSQPRRADCISPRSVVLQGGAVEHTDGVGAVDSFAVPQPLRLFRGGGTENRGFLFV